MRSLIVGLTAPLSPICRYVRRGFAFFFQDATSAPTPLPPATKTLLRFARRLEHSVAAHRLHRAQGSHK